MSMGDEDEDDEKVLYLVSAGNLKGRLLLISVMTNISVCHEINRFQSDSPQGWCGIVFRLMRGNVASTDQIQIKLTFFKARL